MIRRVAAEAVRATIRAKPPEQALARIRKPPAGAGRVRIQRKDASVARKPTRTRPKARKSESAQEKIRQSEEANQFGDSCHLGALPRRSRRQPRAAEWWESSAQDQALMKRGGSPVLCPPRSN
jgi:hypothetical protein